MKTIRIKVVDLIYNRLGKDAEEHGRSLEEHARILIVDRMNSLLIEDSKNPCRGSWHGGHSPKEPNDGIRTVCITCGKGLVHYGLGYDGKWVLDRTKKALHLKNDCFKGIAK